jgi:hypothetical protein
MRREFYSSTKRSYVAKDKAQKKKKKTIVRGIRLRLEIETNQLITLWY